MIYLKVLSGPMDAGRWKTLNHGTWVVGRGGGTAFQLNDPLVSRRQFRITREEGQIHFTIEPVEEIHGPGAGIAIRKGETELAERFNAAIDAIRANGKYKEINDKYFDFDAYGG